VRAAIDALAVPALHAPAPPAHIHTIERTADPLVA